MNTTTPLISVIIPCYNAAKFIVETVQSVLEQTYAEVEIICVDNGSSDNTLTLLAQLKQEHSSLHVFIEKQKGASRARNLGLLQAKGEFIQFLDGDDLLHPEKFERQMKFAIEHHYDVVVSDRIIKDEKMQEVLERLTFEDVESHPLETAITSIIITGNPIYRKEVVDKVGGYTAELPMAQDWDFHFKLFLDRPKIGYCPGDFLISRKVENSLSSNWKEVGEVSCMLLKQYFEDFKQQGITDNEKVLFKVINTYFSSAVFQPNKEKVTEYIEQIEKWVVGKKASNYLRGSNKMLTRLVGLGNAIRLKRLMS